VGATFLIFAGSRFLVDPVMVYLIGVGDLDAEEASFTQEDYDRARAHLNLDKPLIVQYVLWISKIAQGDFGEDLGDEGRPIFDNIKKKIPITLRLAIPAYILAALVGIPVGVYASIRRGTISDIILRGVAALGSAAPEFWVAIVAIYMFAVKFPILPIAFIGEGFTFKHYILPVSVMGLTSTAGYIRLVRSTMLEVLDSEYVKLARAKGLSHREIIWKHAFRNALLAPLTVAGLMFVGFLTGSVAVELVFAWPGIARYAVVAVQNNNLPVLVATTLLITLTYVIVTFTVDILYGLIDPRIRYS